MNKMPYYYSLYYGGDAIWVVLMLVAYVFTLIAQVKVKSTFNKYSKHKSARALTGAQAARMILDRNGLRNVRIERVSGSLSDHYDPKANVVRLSDTVHDNDSIAAIGVAAHECGHAVQYAVGYGPIRLRMAILPVTQFGSSLAFPLIFIGLLLQFTGLAYLGVALFALATFFQLVTLPVEFNASSRALAVLSDYGTLDDDELRGAKKVLSAAAMTYVAALAVSLTNLLRLLSMVNRRNR